MFEAAELIFDSITRVALANMHVLEEAAALGGLDDAETAVVGEIGIGVSVVGRRCQVGSHELVGGCGRHDIGFGWFCWC